MRRNLNKMQFDKGFYSINAQRIKYVTGDLVATSFAFLLFNISRFYSQSSYQLPGYDIMEYLTQPEEICLQVIVPTALLFIYWISGYYNKPVEKSRLQEFTTTFYSSLFNAIVISFILLQGFNMQSKSDALLMTCSLFLSLMFFVYNSRLFITMRGIRHYRKHRYTIPTIVIGCSHRSLEVTHSLEEDGGFIKNKVMAYVRIPGETDAPEIDKEIYDESDMDYVCSDYDIRQIIISPQIRNDKTILKYLDKAFHLEIPVRIAPDTFSLITSGVKLSDIMANPYVDLTSPRMSEFSKNMKMSIDYIVSFLMIILLSPIMAALAIIIKRESGGPIIYKQQRIGKHQKPFEIYKFRTMVINAEQNGPKLSYRDDPRITPSGKWMRKYRLDEIPQFWNVLRGEMSLVGPRPEREYYVKKIMKHAPYYCLVNQIKPGITSWGMVKYGYASSIEEIMERVRYELIYMANMSISVDIKIIIYTIRTILSGTGK